MSSSWLRRHVARVLQLLGTANILPNSLIFSILMMEVIRCSETSFYTRAAGLHILEDGILKNHCLESL
jgi:hypothetical protein